MRAEIATPVRGLIWAKQALGACWGSQLCRGPSRGRRRYRVVAQGPEERPDRLGTSKSASASSSAGRLQRFRLIATAFPAGHLHATNRRANFRGSAQSARESDSRYGGVGAGEAEP